MSCVRYLYYHVYQFDLYKFFKRQSRHWHLLLHQKITPAIQPIPVAEAHVLGTPEAPAFFDHATNNIIVSSSCSLFTVTGFVINIPTAILYSLTHATLGRFFWTFSFTTKKMLIILPTSIRLTVVLVRGFN